MNLWRTFESAGELTDVLPWWRMRLGTEFESLRRFLVATDRNAASYPSESGRRFRVVADMFGVTAMDNDSGVAVELTPDDIVCWRWDVRRFSREIAGVLKIAEQHERVSRTLHETKVGDLSIELGGRPVYLCLRGSASLAMSALTNIAAHARQPYLVLYPTGQIKTHAVDAILKATDGVMMSLDSLLTLDSTGRFVEANDSQRQVALALGIATTEPLQRNTFHLVGDIREMWFDSQRHMMPETAGTWYIAALLAQPNRPIEATELEALRVGTDARRAGGVDEEVVDEESLQRYEQRVREIARELDIAKRNNDLAEQSALQSEQAAIVKEIGSAKGLGGRIRKRSDATRTANTVSQNITRDIKKIRKHHESLANHLASAITRGSTLAYRPDRDYAWML